VKALRADFRDDFINTRSYRGTEDQIGRDFDRAENYLSMVGLAIVSLGGIAVSSVTRVFIVQKIRAIAVVKCVGAGNPQIIRAYPVQVVLLGVAVSQLGVAIARAAVAAIPIALEGATGAGATFLASAHYGVTCSAAAHGVGIGVLISFLFSIVPLLH